MLAQAGSVLKALAKEPLSLWEVLGLLGPRQLQALSSSPDFYHLPVLEGPPPTKLPPLLLEALLEVRCLPGEIVLVSEDRSFCNARAVAWAFTAHSCRHGVQKCFGAWGPVMSPPGCRWLARI